MIPGRRSQGSAAGEAVGKLRSDIAANRNAEFNPKAPMEVFTRSLLADQQEILLQSSLKAMRQAGCGDLPQRP